MDTEYGKSSQDEVEKEMRRYKKGTAHSGPKLKKVESREQAIAIGLSKARKKGAKVPPAPSSKSQSSKKKTTKPKTKKKSTVKKKPATAKKRTTKRVKRKTSARNK